MYLHAREINFPVYCESGTVLKRGIFGKDVENMSVA